MLACANEAVLPFYLLYQTAILCAGWFVFFWDMAMLPKFLIIALVSFALIIALYELLIGRLNIVRFFCGMRPKKKSSAVSSPRPEKKAA